MLTIFYIERFGLNSYQFSLRIPRKIFWIQCSALSEMALIYDSHLLRLKIDWQAFMPENN